MKNIRAVAENITEAVLNSYSMVFFSKNHGFAAVLMLVSFVDPVAGISGLMSTLVSTAFARILGLQRFAIRSGFYGFNALLVGLGLGLYFQLSAEFLLLLFFSALITLLITILLEGITARYSLPYLTLPFLFSYWMVSLAARQYSGLQISERGIYQINEMYSLGGSGFITLSEWINSLPLPQAVVTYFKSLSAIFFQFHLLTGVVVAIGLISYSRIAFLLSVLGYMSAYMFYHIIGADFNELNYSFIGFNYILTAIAIGGFYIVASPFSIIWVIILTPVISVFVSGTSVILGVLQLSVFSLPFNVSVLLFLYVLRFRETPDKYLQSVTIQEYSPEKNLYNQKNLEYRFPAGWHVAIRLPFLGEWKVTQGHSDELTHRENWKHAWDFEITDENERTYQNDGYQLSDYYCFNKPVVAPAAGYVEEVCNHLEDNAIGDIDIQNNWGNTVVIKHSDTLYSKLSHLRKNSITVSKGDKVSTGQIVASCGNSGRSPYPHLHFQLQATPFIGSYTIQYPVSQYVKCNANQNLFAANAIPQKGDHVLNLNTNHSLSEAFHFIPGQVIEFEITVSNGSMKNERWEVLSDMYNQTYLYCPRTKSKAFFVNTEGLFYFTWYEGKHDSLLKYFYLGAYKVSAGYYNKLLITDLFPLKVMKNSILKVIQDIVAPFYIFSRVSYTMRYVKLTDLLHPCEIHLQSTCSFSFFRHKTASVDFDIFIANNQIERFEFCESSKITKAKRITSTQLHKDLQI